MTPAAAPNATDAADRRRGRYLATVVASVPLCREHNRLTFRINRFPQSAPGQFVQVKCRDVDDAPLGAFTERALDWPPNGATASHFQPDDLLGAQPDLLRPTPILRRPFSIAARRSTPAGEEIDLINRDIGPGTHWLLNLQAGQSVDLIGPLGNTFSLPGPGGLALLVGGGVGIPPMIYIAQALAELNADARQPAPRRAVAFCGALSIDLMPLTITGDAGDPAAPRANVREFAEYGFPTVLSTDDGSYGYHGRVTGALELFLDRLDPGEPPPTLYTCGPEAMMKAVATIARRRGLPCQVAVERAMACGMGTCQSCVIRQTADDQRGWRYRLACTDGPVFDASTLLW